MYTEVVATVWQKMVLKSFMRINIDNSENATGDVNKKHRKQNCC